MTLKKISPLLLILALLLAACARGAAEQAADEAGAPAMPAIEAPMEEAESSEDMAFNSGGEATAVQEPGQARLIIRTADMSVVVGDTEEAMDTIGRMVTDNGGWVVSSSVFQYNETAKTGNMTVRVPAEGFESFLEAVRRLAVEVTRVSTSGQDVTEEYVDLSARLENLEATAERVRAFLDEAETVEEALQVNQELSRLEGEIESLKGRIQYLEQSAAFSTVSIDLTPDELSQPLEVGGWQPEGVVREAIAALISAGQVLINVLIWTVIFLLPILLVVVVPLWLLVRFVRRRRRARTTPAEQSGG